MGRRQTRKKRKICQIPIPAIVSSSFSKGDDFYTWVNSDWLKDAEIPPFENSIGVGEEIQHCINKFSKEILADIEIPAFKNFKESCLNSKVQNNSVEFLHEELKRIDAIQSKEEVFQIFAEMSSRRFVSIFNLQEHTESDKTIRMLIDANCPGLHISYYNNPRLMIQYKKFMHILGELFHIPDITKILYFERSLVFHNENLWNDTRYKIKGFRLERKFPYIPWNIWFTIVGMPNWRKETLYYTSPQWIRFIGKQIRIIPIHYWKLYLVKCYIINSLHILPPPYNDLEFNFFERDSLGQKEKIPRDDLYLKLVYDYLQEDFSRIFWQKAGNPKIVSEIREFAENIVDAAKRHLETTDWLMYKTRLAAIKKISYMSIQTVRPEEFAPPIHISLDPKNLLKNLYTLGEYNTQVLISRLGDKHKFWSEGIYNVNAYYFNENNEMMIPYGSCVSPFYSLEKNTTAWNFGGLGSIIGHEMCHAFDEEGKDYNEKGEKKRWWLRKDNRAYHHKTKELIALFNRQIVEHRHIHGKRTLSENIADLGGVGISLQALKDDILKRNLDPIQIKEEYRLFFISYAVSWRTKYRKEKLLRSINIDVHSPANLRVNLIVSQFDEWYAAFDITSNDRMFIHPEDRIRIF